MSSTVDRTSSGRDRQSVATAAPDSRWTAALICVLLVVATVACYWRVQYYPFLTYDDPRYLEDPLVRGGPTAGGFGRAFTSVHFANWHPLTTISFMIERELWGLNPRPFHLTNILLHAASTALLFLTLRSLTGATWRSAFVAVIFGLHPLHVESVAWVAERKDVLSGLFWILTIAAYTAYARRGGWGRYLLALALFALGLLSKPMLVTLPFVLLLLDYWPLGRLTLIRAGSLDNSARSSGLGRARLPASRSPKGAAGQEPPPAARMAALLLEKAPFLLLSIISSALTVYAQKAGGAVVSVENVPLDLRLSNALVSYVSYLAKAFWPANLVALYPLPDSYPAAQVAGAAMVLLALTTLVLWYGRRPGRGYLLTGWFWYLGTLVPVIGLVQVGAQAMADRYTYIPLIGFTIALAWGVGELLSRWRLAPAVTTAACLLLLPLMAQRTWAQTWYWQDSLRLFERVVQVHPRNPVAQFNLANAYYRDRRFDQAIECYQRALRYEPDYVEAYNGIGLVHVARGENAAASQAFRSAIALYPRYPEAHNSLGSLLMLQGEWQSAEHHIRQAISVSPRYAAAHFNLGLIHSRNGRLAEAEQSFRRSIDLDPTEAGPHHHLAQILHRRADIVGAIRHYRQAIASDPNSPACNNLAWILATNSDATIRNGREAVALAEQLRQRVGDRPEVLDTLAAAYAENGDFARAAQVADDAAERAQAAGNVVLAREVENRLALYRQNKRYREK